MRRVLCTLAILGALVIGGVTGDAEERPTKLAVAADGKTVDSSVDGKGARCRYFILFDENGERGEILENPHRDASGSAGPDCAAFLAQHDVTVFVAGSIGNKMAKALESRSIKHVTFTGSVRDAVDHVLQPAP